MKALRMHTPIARLAAVSMLAAAASACAPDASPTPVTKAPVGEWRAYGADKAGTKYSPLDEINRETMARPQRCMNGCT
jgi:glucose dehydrogenase